MLKLPGGALAARSGPMTPVVVLHIARRAEFAVRALPALPLFEPPQLAHKPEDVV